MDLWSRILPVITPPAIVCLTALPAWYFRAVLQNLGWMGDEPQPIRVGWGNVTYSVSRLTHEGRETLVVRLPHLSRFRVVVKAKCESAVTQLVVALADSIRRRQAA
jgi:hypothetical protein